MDSVLTLKDSQKYQDLLAKQFNAVAVNFNLNNEECWQFFLDQEPTQKVPQANLPTIKEVLHGNSSLLLKDWRNIIIENIKREKYCTLIPVLYSMTEGKLLPELVTHYLKITSIILSEEDMQDPFTVRYRDQDHKLREFCTYAKNGIDARLQALECIEYVASNPRSILDIVREKEHTDSFEW